MEKFYVKISKFLSYVLRHHPEKYKVKIDSEGYTELYYILEILNKKFNNIIKQRITRNTLEDIIFTSNKKRFELKKNKIRAYYGHSFDQKIKMEETHKFPALLYHGTTLKSYNRIKIDGLKKLSRQYVHLSDNVETAIEVGKRRTHTPIILVIDAKKAEKHGIHFYKSGDMYLANFIPPEYISILNSNPN